MPIRALAALVIVPWLCAQDAEALYRRGVTHLRAKKFAEALADLSAAAKLKPAEPVIRVALAHARLETGDTAQARTAAAEARALGASHPDLSRALAAFHHQLALHLRRARDPAGAVAAWQDALALAPRDPAYYAALAGLFLDHRTPEPAVAILETATAKIPGNAELLRLLGLAHYSAGAMDPAVAAFLRLMDTAPDSEDSYTPVETLLPEAGARLPAILERLRKFVASHPASPVGHFLLAQALAAGSPGLSEVEEQLREAIRAEPKFWPAHFELHKPLLARGETRAARESLERAVSLNPDYAPARYALAQVYAALGDRTRAGKERAAHHELLSRARQAAQARQAEMPPLPYQIRK